MNNAKIAELLEQAAGLLGTEEAMYALGLDRDHVQYSETEVITDSKGRSHTVEVPVDAAEAEAAMDREIEAHGEFVQALLDAAKEVRA